MMFDADYGPYNADPRDPRTPEEPGRYGWEETISYTEVIGQQLTDEILFELLHGSPDNAKVSFNEQVERAWQKFLRDQIDSIEE